MSISRCVLPLVLVATSVPFAATAFINQVGYRTSDFKQLALIDGSGDVEFVDAKGQTILKVTPSAASNWNGSNQNVQLVDFTELKTAGTYSIKVGGNVVRSDLKIKDNAYEDVMKATLKFFYYQRASMALEEQYAGQWKRAAGHPDMQVGFHSSAGGSGTVDSPKGWYDAGDYGKYIVNSGISTYTLLALYEHFPDYFNTAKWNIPADGSLPDLLAEIKYNLDWMLTMQANDGGVYHKLTSLDFCESVLPAEDPLERFIIGKSVTATFDFAAVMAVASRVYQKFDATFAEKCLEAAKKAYTWGAANPNALYTKNPNGVNTGAYNDSKASDEQDFAAAELFLTTKDASYKRDGVVTSIPGWAEMGGLMTYEKATHVADYADGAAAKDSLLKAADNYVKNASSGFGVPMSKGDFYWGSNSVAANQGVWLLHAYYVTGDDKYYQAAVKALDYLLGKNPLDMSFVTGQGTKSPKHPHHRPSQGDGIADPVPGMLVGGPQPGGEDVGSFEWECKDYRKNGAPALSYLDDECSYASNEVAINWNSPIAYLAGALEALNAGYAPSFAAANVARKSSGSDAIHGVRAVKRSAESLKLRFADQMIYVEKDGVRYNLKGHKIK